MCPPKVLPFFLLVSLLSLLALNPAEAQQPPAATKPSANLPADMVVALAAQIKNNAEQIGCKPKKCRILVTTFVFPGKGTPPFAFQLSDALSVQLSSGLNSYPVADRTQLQNLLREEFITPETEQFDDIARWLGRKLNANAVLTGEMSELGDKSLELSARLLSTGEFKRKGLSLKGKFNIDLSKVDLTQSNNIPPVPSSGDTVDGCPYIRLCPAGCLSVTTCRILRTWRKRGKTTFQG